MSAASAVASEPAGSDVSVGSDVPVGRTELPGSAEAAGPGKPVDGAAEFAGRPEAAEPVRPAGPSGTAVQSPDPVRTPSPGKPAARAVQAAPAGLSEPPEVPEPDGSEVPGASAGTADPAAGGEGRFTVVLDNFEGPFDLLLQLIARHKLDVTEVALSRVTDEFMAHLRAMGPDWDLDQTTEFLVVAATLLDLKAARLLPSAEVEDEADLALLEARDLLFARLLQYRAYKRVTEVFTERLAAEARRFPRIVGLEPHHAELLPEVVIRIGPEGFARLAVKAMRPRPRPQVYVDHIHAPLVSVREQAGLLVDRLRERGEATFAALTEDAADTLTVVARFLALLELYRERAVALEQPEALGELLVRWRGGASAAEVGAEFDGEAPAEDDRRPAARQSEVSV
ncbi:segregation/condensation protein A [Streptomyces sp. OF3]|uniref:Segregation and condensation protein A n=1 Tax=Streptomyces alkaliterrae TaxID=2213162 RepID=A0A7W3ZNK1_9ACTN|nr:segregation/condensation protein A [Streptomyces alkaliterrae]